MEANKNTHLPTLATTLGEAARKSKVAVARVLAALDDKTGLELKAELAHAENELADQYNTIVNALVREKALAEPAAPTPAASGVSTETATATSSATSSPTPSPSADPTPTTVEPEEGALAVDASEDNQQ